MKVKEEWLGLGPVCLFLGVLGLFAFEPYPNYDELKVVNGTVAEYHWQSSGSWRGGSKYIYVSTDSDFLKFIVFSGKNAIVEGERITVRSHENVAWELEQNGRLLYSLEQTIAYHEKMAKFTKPMVFVSLVAGVFLTPLWFINRRKNRAKVRSLF
ncbi:hypothetical protein A3715_03710 [Oleiphilus sp. HI0009]|nr:hypothetical protein A3715_03710 [Oleiphilus sp. HI0009]